MADDGKLIEAPPCKRDILFRAGFPDWHNNACLDFFEHRDYSYTEGYRLGAGLLTKHVVEGGSFQDLLVYPTVFLYRHHIELALKNLLRRLANGLEQPLTSKEKEHLNQHRLDDLWRDVKPKLTMMSDAAGWERLASEDIEGVESYIQQLTERDENSFAFRYKRSKKGMPSLPEDLPRINIRYFADCMERLADYLSALDAAAQDFEEFNAD